MFVISKSDAAAIRAAFDQGGELSATVELRRLFPRNHQRQGSGVCPDHRWLAAAAAPAPEEATDMPDQIIDAVMALGLRADACQAHA